MTIMWPYEYYLFLLLEEMNRLKAQGHDPFIAYQMARQQHRNLHYMPPAHCTARDQFSGQGPVFLKLVKSDHSPSDNRKR